VNVSVSAIRDKTLRVRHAMRLTRKTRGDLTKQIAENSTDPTLMINGKANAEKPLSNVIFPSTDSEAHSAPSRRTSALFIVAPIARLVKLLSR